MEKGCQISWLDKRRMVPAVIGGKMRVNRVNRDASGPRDRKDGCQHLMGGGVCHLLITYWCQLPAEW